MALRCLGRFGSATIVLLATAFTQATLAVPTFASDTVGFVSGRFALELDGIPAGPVKSVAGGTLRREVSTSAPGTPFPKKTAERTRIDPVVLRMAPPLSPEMFGWLHSVMLAGGTPKNGVATSLSPDGTERSKLAFMALRIDAIEFPELDITSKQPAHITVTGTPESVSTTRGSGEKVDFERPSPSQKAKSERMTASNFRFELEGVDTRGVVHVAPLRIRFSPNGEIANLLVTVGASSQEAFDRWYRDSLVAGTSADSLEKSGTIEFYGARAGASAGGKGDVLLRLKLRGVGMVAYAPALDAKGSDDSKTPPKMVAELYVEDVKLEM